MERKGICKNVGPCTLANKVQVITDDDAEFICTECGEPLEEVKDDPVNVDDELNKKRKTKRLIFILLAVILLAAIGFCIYSLLSGSKGPQKINLVQKELTMKVGETQVITPTVEPEGEKATFIFKPQGKIVKATSGGEITALKKGETTIIVKCEENPEIRAICKVKVEDTEVVPEPEPQPQEPTATEPEETKKEEPKADPKKKDPEHVDPPVKKSEIERYGTYAGARKNGLPDGTGKVTFTKPYQLNSQYTAQPGEYIQGIFENGKPSFVTYYQKDGTVTKIKLR